MMIKVLFVCLGNICRSPMAEGIFRKMVEDEGLSHKILCDSAGTSDYHTGDLPDHRMRKTAQRYGITLTHRARQICPADFTDYDYILAMDQANHLEITRHEAWDTSLGKKLVLFRSHDAEAAGDLNVPDPYFGGLEGFETVYQMLWKTSRRFLDYLIEQYQLK